MAMAMHKELEKMYGDTLDARKAAAEKMNKLDYQLKEIRRRADGMES